MATSLETARRLLARGLSVIPIPLPQLGVSDGKTAAMPWKEYQSRLPTLAELAQWFATEQNIAVICGAVSGVVVVDVDALDARAWWMAHRPFTPWCVHTAKGAHFYYRHPGGCIRNRVRLETPDGKFAIDIRSDSGYVISPGSLHSSGVRYRAAGDWCATRSALPVFNPNWIERPRPKALLARNSSETTFLASNAAVDIRIRAAAYLAKIPVPEIGCGSDRAVFYAACRLVRRFALSDADAEELLWQWCGNRDGWTREWVNQKILNAHKHGTEPVGV